MSKAISYADFPWPEAGRETRKNTKVQYFFVQYTLRVERILWVKAVCLIT